MLSEYVLPPDQEVFKYVTDMFVDDLHDGPPDAPATSSNTTKDNNNPTHSNVANGNGLAHEPSIIGFRVTFYLKDNPYMSNSLLFKEFLDPAQEGSPPIITQSVIQWKEVCSLY